MLCFALEGIICHSIQAHYYANYQPTETLVNLNLHLFGEKDRAHQKYDEPKHKIENQSNPKS